MQFLHNFSEILKQCLRPLLADAEVRRFSLCNYITLKNPAHFIILVLDAESHKGHFYVDHIFLWSAVANTNCYWQSYSALNMLIIYKSEPIRL